MHTRSDRRGTQLVSPTSSVDLDQRRQGLDGRAGAVAFRGREEVPLANAAQLPAQSAQRPLRSAVTPRSGGLGFGDDGSVGVSDIVAEDRLTNAERAERGSYVGCIAGALSFAEYEAGLRTAGFEDVSLTPTHEVADEMFAAIVKATKKPGTTESRAPAGSGAASNRRELPLAEAGTCC